MTKSESTDSFKTAIAAAGLQPPDHIEPGRWVRFPGIGKKEKNQAGFAFMFLDGLGGMYGDFSSGVKETWHAEKVKEFGPVEMADFKKIVENARKEAEKRQVREHAKAARKAQELWEGLCSARDTHKYLKAKNVASYGLRGHKSKLVMPLISPEGVLSTQNLLGKPS